MRSASRYLFLLIIFIGLNLSAALADERIDINSLDRNGLKELGFSKALSDKIMAFRTLVGPFKEERDLQAIKGVGRKTLVKLRDKITFSNEVTGPREETALTLLEVLRADKLMMYRPDTKVNINTAGPEELITLPGIREGLARKIIIYRTENGAFTSPEQLKNLHGIRRKTYQKMERYLDVGDAKTIKRLDEFSLFSGKNQQANDTSPVILEPAIKGDGQLHVYMIDVGQGDSILIVTPKGYTMLVDAAETSSARKAILPLLEKLQIQRLNHFVLTHGHLDHLGGAVTVLKKVDADQVWDSGYPAATQTYKKLLRAVEKKKIRYGLGRDGVTIQTDSGITLQMLHPDSRFLAYGTHSDENMNSTVVKLAYGKFSLLLTGDIEADTEERLVKLHKKEIRCQLLKAPHHGGEFSSTIPFLQAVAPEIILISVGEGNSFGHPNPDTLKKYQDLKAKVYRTDKSGTIHLISDGKKLTVEEEFPKASRPAKTKEQKAGHKGQITLAEFGEPVNINIADVKTLATIPMVGLRTAEKIYADREANGPFTTVENLCRVKGIGKKLLSRMREFITVGSAPTAPETETSGQNEPEEPETQNN